MSSWWIEPLKILWLAFPVMFAAAVHIVVIRKDAFAHLRVPLDGGRTWRGRRILGDNKTHRGVLVIVLASGVGAVLQGIVRIPSLEYFDYGEANLALTGLLLGAGFALGELPNSFLKRRFGVAAGSRGNLFFILLDQVDSIVGALALLSFVWVAPLHVWVVALVLCSLVHMAFNTVFVLVGLKERVF